MTDFRVENVIIGAGVVGLALGYHLSKKNKEILILEKENDFGKITSSRNSGVIHAGLYYPKDSLKRKFCVLGNQLVYEYCKKNHIPHINTKKLIVASSNDQIEIIENLKKQAEINEVEGVKNISQNEVKKIEPLIYCEEALLVPSSGIVDPIVYMRSLVGKIENTGNMIAYKSNIKKINYDGNNFNLLIQNTDNKEETIIKCKTLINSAGLYASDIANNIEELKKEFIPKTFFGKGNYFNINKDLGIRHLIYPVPNEFSLGLHLTPELDNSVKFGPDFEWVDNSNDYTVNINKKEIFINEIKKYLPDLDTSSLSPSYAGIRPIIEKNDQSKRDFNIQTVDIHSIPHLVNLFGIDSPGLTSSLALAKHIESLLS